MRKGIILKKNGKYDIKSLHKLIPKRNKLDKIKYILLPIMNEMYKIYLPLVPTELMYSTKITVEMMISVYSVDYETEEITYLNELYDDREFDDYISFINYIYTVYKSDGFNIIFSSLKSDSYNVEILEFLKITRLDIKFYKDTELKDNIFYEAEDPSYQNYYVNGIEALNHDLIALLGKIIAPTYNPYSQPKRLESIVFDDSEYEFVSINDLKNNINCDFILYPLYEFNSFITISPEEINNLSKTYSSRLFIITLPKTFKYYDNPQIMSNFKNLMIRDEISGDLEICDHYEYLILYYDRILTLIPYMEYICSYLEFIYMNYLDEADFDDNASNILIKVTTDGRRLSDCDYYLLPELKDSNNIKLIISKLLEGEDND